MSSQKEFMSMEEAASMLGMARATLYKYTMSKKIPFYRIGKFLRFERNELIAWIEERRVDPETEG